MRRLGVELAGAHLMPPRLLHLLLRQDRVHEREELRPRAAAELVDVAHQLQQAFLQQVLGVDHRAQRALGRQVPARHVAQPRQELAQRHGVRRARQQAARERLGVVGNDDGASAAQAQVQLLMQVS